MTCLLLYPLGPGTQQVFNACSMTLNKYKRIKALKIADAQRFSTIDWNSSTFRLRKALGIKLTAYLVQMGKLKPRKGWRWTRAASILSPLLLVTPTLPEPQRDSLEADSKGS